MTLIERDTIGLLEDISKNNNRPWFTSQKDRYAKAHQNVKQFLVDMTSEMNNIDRIEKSKLFRIYRDVRFSHNKTPYNTHWSMSMGRAKPNLRGGYYLKLSPDGAMIACGFWNPNPADIALIRGNIDQNDQLFRKAIADKELKNTYGEMEGKTVKSAPKGYSKDHPSIDLLKHKQFIFTKDLTKEQVHSKGFLKEVVNSYRTIRPFFDYMSEILGHNLNGESLYER